jgi:hypothetical protein
LLEQMLAAPAASLARVVMRCEFESVVGICSSDSSSVPRPRPILGAPVAAMPLTFTSRALDRGLDAN